MTTSLLCPDAFLSPLEIDAVVTRALAEDLGRAGDVTSIATIPEDTPAHAIVVARAAGVIAGLPLVAATFEKLAPGIRIAANGRDGMRAAAKTALMTVDGPARAVLSAERVALNLLGRLSGVATATHEFVRRVAGTHTRICCTRKTTPGLRALEKYAVRCGGGFNHRFGLDDAILIKDNHIAVAGGIRAVLERAKAAAGHLVKIEIEVDTLDQLREVLAVGLADAVLLDNMDLATPAPGGGDGRRQVRARGLGRHQPGTPSPRSRRPASIMPPRAGSRTRRPTSTWRSTSRCELPAIRSGRRARRRRRAPGAVPIADVRTSPRRRPAGVAATSTT
jgi:nicotinate-nucleotide pyrophosphorylase (carboxylating)